MFEMRLSSAQNDNSTESWEKLSFFSVCALAQVATLSKCLLLFSPEWGTSPLKGS